MSHCHNQTNITRVATRRQQPHSPWFWFSLTGGSIVLHLGLIGLVENLPCCSLAQGGVEAVLPVDFVELPASVTSPNEAASNPISVPPTAVTASSAPTAPTSISKIPQATEVSTSDWGDIAAIASLSPQESSPIDVNSATQTHANSKFVTPTAPESTAPGSTASPVAALPAESSTAEPLATPEATVPSSEINPSDSNTESDIKSTVESGTDGETENATESDAEQLSPSAAALPTEPAASSRIVQSQSQPQLEIEQRPIPLPSPSPLIATQRIDVPVPDVSETFIAEAEQSAETVTEEITVPSELTASLTATSTETNDLPLDEVAAPKQEVQTFAANSANSPCTVSPEAVPFLGKTVAMQVMTDESGQVVNTVTQESSQSTAYDELATCLVKNWEFEPATAQGQPIADNGLVVRITIEADG